jgi:hypothetical protein
VGWAIFARSLSASGKNCDEQHERKHEAFHIGTSSGDCLQMFFVANFLKSNINSTVKAGYLRAVIILTTLSFVKQAMLFDKSLANEFSRFI